MTRRTPRRPALLGWFLPLVLAGGAAVPAARAHDVWLQPSTYFAARGQEVAVTLALGEHGHLEAGKPLRRADLVRFGLFGGHRPTQDLLHQLPREGDLPAATFRTEGGNTLLAMERAPKRLDQAPAEFARYLTEEGQTEALARRAQAGQGDQPGRERYRRYLKTLVQDEAEASAAPAVLYRRRIGQRLEILLENNPGRLRPGQPVRVRVLFENRPLPGARVTALAPPAARRPGGPHARRDHGSRRPGELPAVRRERPLAGAVGAPPSSPDLVPGPVVVIVAVAVGRVRRVGGLGELLGRLRLRRPPAPARPGDAADPGREPRAASRGLIEARDGRSPSGRLRYSHCPSVHPSLVIP